MGRWRKLHSCTRETFLYLTAKEKVLDYMASAATAQGTVIVMAGHRREQVCLELVQNITTICSTMPSVMTHLFHRHLTKWSFPFKPNRIFADREPIFYKHGPVAAA